MLFDLLKAHTAVLMLHVHAEVARKAVKIIRIEILLELLLEHGARAVYSKGPLLRKSEVCLYYETFLGSRRVGTKLS